MSSKRIDELLQECLNGYAAGLTPEECLARSPEHRAELEPLLRQALSLRIAFAGRPSEEFRYRGRERLMFAAGREVSQAFAVEPDEDFALETRRKLIFNGGAAAQEALRNVPPPRLPFWVNARRHVLEEATARAVQQQARPVARQMPQQRLGFRAGLSMAAVVMAVAIAGAAFFSNPLSHATSVGAEYAQLEQQTQAVEQQLNSGAPVSPSIIAELTKRTNDLAGRLDDQPSSPVASMLPALIDRQWNVIDKAAAVSTQSIKPPADVQVLAEAQQSLQQADDKVHSLAVKQSSASSGSSPSTSSTSSSSVTSGGSTGSGSSSSSSSSSSSGTQGTSGGGTSSQPSAVSSPAATNSPVSQSATGGASVAGGCPPLPAASLASIVAPGQVRITVQRGDTTGGLTWVEIKTSDMRFLAPASWCVVGVTQEPNGTATLGSGTIGFAGPDIAVVTNVRTHNFDAVLNGQSLSSFQVLDSAKLAAQAGTLAPILRHMTDSVEVTTPAQPAPQTAPAPAATPTRAAAPTATATPQPSPAGSAAN